MTDRCFDQIVEETNRYAEQFMAANILKPFSRARQWRPTDRTEIKAFFAIHLLMGLNKKSTLASYWTTDPLMKTPFFRAIFPRDRWLLILKFLHYNNNENQPPRADPNRDRLFKIRPLLDHLNLTFKLVFTPGKNIAIDESLLLWKGRLVFKQYVPMKRARYGIKSFLLCDSSGYTYSFRVYAGKDESTQEVHNAIEARLQGTADTLGVSGKEVCN